MGTHGCWQAPLLVAGLIAAEPARAQPAGIEQYAAWERCFTATAKRYAATAEPAESAARIVAIACVDGRARYQVAIQAPSKPYSEVFETAKAVENGFIRDATLAIMEHRAPK